MPHQTTKLARAILIFFLKPAIDAGLQNLQCDNICMTNKAVVKSSWQTARKLFFLFLVTPNVKTRSLQSNILYST